MLSPKRFFASALPFAGLLLLSIAQPSLALPPLEQPYQVLQPFDFGQFGTLGEWDANAGTWALDGETYNVTSAAPKSIATINSYLNDYYGEDDYTYEPRDDFRYHARVMNESAGADTRVGLVYNYQDANNYYELTFTPTRVVQARRVLGGTSTVLLEKTYAEGGAGKWLDIELFADHNRNTLVVNGILIAKDMLQTDFPKGRLGLIAYNTTARFDLVSIAQATIPFFHEDFQDGVAQEFNVDTNNWTISDGVLKNFTVQQVNKQRVAVHNPWYGGSSSIRVKMRNPYGARGNLVGVYTEDGLYEILFSRTGTVRMDLHDYDGSVRTVASSSIPILSSDWFEVIVIADAVETSAYLNGTLVLSYQDGTLQREGDIGLITRWSPGQFDNIDYNNAFLISSPRIEQFATAPAATVWSGTWAASSGTYNSTARGATDLSELSAMPTPNQPYAPQASMNFSYRARVQVPSTSQGSTGVVTHVSPDGHEYYEFLLTGAGHLTVNKHVQGTIVRQADTTYSVTPGTWVDLEIQCVDNKTKMLVNGVSRLSGILQGQLQDGAVGVITHSTTGKFDNLIFSEIK